MQVIATLTVKGTRYYKAAELLHQGALSSGIAIRLKHQPSNPHDKNAVAVLVNRTGAMLGHLSKDLSGKYAALIYAGKIIEASIASIAQNGKYTNIEIRVVYEQSDEQLVERHNSRLWRSASTMPTAQGVYAILNVESGRQYVGSANSINERIHSHIKDLLQGCHANHALQSDFTKFGANNFEVKILAKDVVLSNLANIEARCISSLQCEGAALYNMTADGQGAGYRPGKHSISLPISDRIGKKGTGVEQGQTAFAISKKSGAKSCFVATACYGAADESTVVALRRYREVVLKKRPLDAPLYIGTTS